MLRCFLLSLFFTVSLVAQVPIGATKQEVIDKLGWPKSTSGSEAREILNYAEYSVLLVDGRVDKLQFKPKAGRLPNRSMPPTPKTTPRRETQVRTPTPEEALGPKRDRVDPIPTQVTETSKPPPTQAPAGPSARVQPRPDPFASAKSTVLWMGLFLGLALAVKLWIKSVERRKRGKRDVFGDPARWTDTPTDEPPLILTQRQGRAQAEPPRMEWSLALLKEIEWHRFEQLVAAYERELGNEAELTGFGPDGGIDVQVFASNTRTLKRVIQCKAFKSQPVGVDLVRAFIGAMTIQKIPFGAFYTTSSYTDDALAIGRSSDSLELVDGPTFLNRIQRLDPAAQSRLLDLATEGDYTTPTCPSCGVKMIIKTFEGNPTEEKWACRNFPRCRQKTMAKRQTT